MPDRLDDLLRTLPGPALDHPLDQLEPAVWRRIEASGRTTSGPSIGFQLIAAGMALAIGLALGWRHAGGGERPDDVQALYASYAELGPLAKLENGL